MIFGRACRDFCMRTQRLTAADANWEARLPIDTLYLHIAKASLAGEAHCEWEGGCRAQALVYCVDHNTALCAEHDKHVHAGLLHMHVRETCMAGCKQWVQPDQVLGEAGQIVECTFALVPCRDNFFGLCWFYSQIVPCCM